MTDYIDRETVTREIVKRALENFYDTEATASAINVVQTTPAADVIEVVRCKDCKNYQTDWKPKSFDDGHYCAIVDTMMPYEGFCHDGERRLR